MPINPKLRRFYGKAWQTEICPSILRRDGYRCTRCGVPNYSLVDARTRKVLDPFIFKASKGKVTFVRLGVAHINRKSGDDRPENLTSLCARCHLILDGPHHAIAAKRTRAARNDAERPLLEIAGA